MAESRKAIFAALGANCGIAVAKMAAFAFTGSSSMLAESIHSLADTGNQGLLLLGHRSARRAATREHPFGYGQHRFVNAFIVALVLFSVGGLFALFEGVQRVAGSLAHPQPLEHWGWAVGTLAVAAVLESLSFRTAISEATGRRGNRSWAHYVHEAKDPELIVVLFEDGGALIGLGLALAGVLASVATGNNLWDGVATLAIGALLVVMAAVLGTETRSMLLGESAAPEALDAIEAAVVDVPGVESVIHLRTMHLGPEEILIGLKVAVLPTASAAELAVTINALEARIRAAVPIACVIYIEPDIYVEPTPAAPSPGPAR